MSETGSVIGLDSQLKAGFKKDVMEIIGTPVDKSIMATSGTFAIDFVAGSIYVNITASETGSTWICLGSMAA